MVHDTPSGHDKREVQQLRIRSQMKFSWSDLDPQDIGGFVQLVTGVGNAVILGTTSDGGALAVTILQGDERIKDWPKDGDAFKQLLEWAEGAYGKL
jgi:hypothetical protein